MIKIALLFLILTVVGAHSYLVRTLTERTQFYLTFLTATLFILGVVTAYQLSNM